MSKNSKTAVCLALALAALMAVSCPSQALAQCGGLSGSGDCQQHMNSSGHMGNGHNMGQNGSAAPGQTGQTTTANPYVATNPSASGYAVPDTSTGSGNTASDHSGHAGH